MTPDLETQRSQLLDALFDAWDLSIDACPKICRRLRRHIDRALILAKTLSDDTREVQP